MHNGCMMDYLCLLGMLNNLYNVTAIGFVGCSFNLYYVTLYGIVGWSFNLDHSKQKCIQ